MAISINHITRVIYVPQADLTPLGGAAYELDLDAFRLTLKDWEDSEVGIQMPNTHNHNTQVTLAGVTFARTLEIINGYTVTFEDGQYSVSLSGANSNIADVTNINQVSVRSANSAGLIVVGGADPSAVADAVFSKVIEGSLNLQHVARLMIAALAGKLSGAEGTSIHIRDTGDSKDRIVATVDAFGNRTTITLDPA